MPIPTVPWMDGLEPFAYAALTTSTRAGARRLELAVAVPPRLRHLRPRPGAVHALSGVGVRGFPKFAVGSVNSLQQLVGRLITGVAALDSVPAYVDAGRGAAEARRSSDCDFHEEL